MRNVGYLLDCKRNSHYDVKWVNGLRFTSETSHRKLKNASFLYNAKNEYSFKL